MYCLFIQIFSYQGRTYWSRELGKALFDIPYIVLLLLTKIMNFKSLSFLGWGHSGKPKFNANKKPL